MKTSRTPSDVQTFLFAYNYMQPPARVAEMRRAAAAAAANARSPQDPAEGGDVVSLKDERGTRSAAQKSVAAQHSDVGRKPSPGRET